MSSIYTMYARLSRNTAGNWSRRVHAVSEARMQLFDLFSAREGPRKWRDRKWRRSSFEWTAIETVDESRVSSSVSPSSPTYIYICRIERFFFRGCITRFAPRHTYVRSPKGSAKRQSEALFARALISIPSTHFRCGTFAKETKGSKAFVAISDLDEFRRCH